MAQELKKKKHDLMFPIIHAFFGDSASANLDSEIAVFVEQCYQKRDMLREKHGQRTSPPDTTRKVEIQSVPSSKRDARSLSGVKEL
jgi:hypothetical protein